MMMMISEYHNFSAAMYFKGEKFTLCTSTWNAVQGVSVEICERLICVKQRVVLCVLVLHDGLWWTASNQTAVGISQVSQSVSCTVCTVCYLAFIVRDILDLPTHVACLTTCVVSFSDNQYVCITH